MSVGEFFEEGSAGERITINRFVNSWRNGLRELGYSADDVRVEIVRAPESPTGWGISFLGPDRETMEAVAELWAEYEAWAASEDNEDQCAPVGCSTTGSEFLSIYTVLVALP